MLEKFRFHSATIVPKVCKKNLSAQLSWSDLEISWWWPWKGTFGHAQSLFFHIWGFPKIWGTPKWMVKIMENPIQIDDLGGKPAISGNNHMWMWLYHFIITLSRPHSCSALMPWSDDAPLLRLEVWRICRHPGDDKANPALGDHVAPFQTPNICTKMHQSTSTYHQIPGTNSKLYPTYQPVKKTIWEGFCLLNHYSKKIVLAHSPNMTKIPILNIGYQFSPARNFNTEVTEGFLSTLCIEQSDSELQKWNSSGSAILTDQQFWIRSGWLCRLCM